MICSFMQIIGLVMIVYVQFVAPLAPRTWYGAIAACGFAAVVKGALHVTFLNVLVAFVGAWIMIMCLSKMLSP